MEIRLLPFPCCANSSLRPLRNPSFSFTQNPNFSANVRCFSTRFHRSRGNEGGDEQYWDSNGSTFRAERFKFSFGEESFRDEEEDGEDEDMGFRRRRKRRRSWWSDNSPPEMEEGWSGVLETAIDSIWIFKVKGNSANESWRESWEVGLPNFLVAVINVFKSFGWLFPFFILSLLLATGPKAFLLALALPLGQSVISLAVNKVWERIHNSQKPRSRKKKQPFSSAASSVEMNEEEKQERTDEAGKERWGYQSWMVADDGSVKKGGQRGPTFSGWDELDRQGESEKRATRRPPRTTGGTPRPQVERKGKWSRRGRNRDIPLLVRLLIAVFPFLGSWTRML